MSPARPLLEALSVLVVEDEAIISFMLEDIVAGLGATDIRHAASLADALAEIELRLPAVAVLDVNLGGERVYPAAERLLAAGVPFVFTTGYGKSGLDLAWQDCIVVQKPFNTDQMAAALTKLLTS
jgi:CheY-like chemotaxis protein